MKSNIERIANRLAFACYYLILAARWAARRNAGYAKYYLLNAWNAVTYPW